MKEEKTSKVTSIVKQDKQDTYGNDQYNIEFENGDKGSHACKNLKFKGGEEATYEIELLEGTSKKTGKEYSFHKITLPKTDDWKGGGGKSNYKEETPEKQSIILAQSQMDNACNLIAAGIIVLKEGEKLSTVAKAVASSLMTVTIANAQEFVPYLKAYQESGKEQPKAE